MHRDGATSPAVGAALPSLQGILGIPLLIAAIPVEVAGGAFDVVTEVSLGLGVILAGLGTGDNAEVQEGINFIETEVPKAINQTVQLVSQAVGDVAKALGVNVDAADRDQLARAASVADEKTEGALGVVKKPFEQPKPADTTTPDTTKDTTKGDTTKGDTTKGATPSPTPPRPTRTKPDAPSDTTKADTTKGLTPPRDDATKPSGHSSTAVHHAAPRR